MLPRQGERGGPRTSTPITATAHQQQHLSETVSPASPNPLPLGDTHTWPRAGHLLLACCHSPSTPRSCTNPATPRLCPVPPLPRTGHSLPHTPGHRPQQSLLLPGDRPQTLSHHPREHTMATSPTSPGDTPQPTAPGDTPETLTQPKTWHSAPPPPPRHTTIPPRPPRDMPQPLTDAQRGIHRRRRCPPPHTHPGSLTGDTPPHTHTPPGAQQGPASR